MGCHPPGMGGPSMLRCLSSNETTLRTFLGQPWREGLGSESWDVLRASPICQVKNEGKKETRGVGDFSGDEPPALPTRAGKSKSGITIPNNPTPPPQPPTLGRDSGSV